MPEAAINEDGLPVSWEYEVRRAWKALAVQSVPKPEGVGQTPHDELGFRVLAPNSPHVMTSQFGAEIIHCFVGNSLIPNRLRGGVGIILKQPTEACCDMTLVARSHVLGLGSRVFSIEPDSTLADVVAGLVLRSLTDEFLLRHDPNGVQPLRVKHESVVLAHLVGQCGEQRAVAERD